MHKRKPREIALQVLERRENSAQPVEALLARALPGLSSADRHLCQELVYGCARQQVLLDWLIAQRTGYRVQKAGLQRILRLGLYQLCWLERIPDHATVNETVDLARVFGCGAQAGFVNALLRGYARDRVETQRLIENLKRQEPHLGHSHPQWLCERWVKRWGADALDRLLTWNNTPPPTYARVNTLRLEPGALLERWREEGVDYEFPRYSWVPENRLFRLKSHPPLATLNSFRMGGFYVQDPSTLLAVAMLDPHPGDRVLDLCAAPGGKTAAIAEAMRNEGQLVAMDENPERLARLRENCARLGIEGVELRRANALDTAAWTGSERFDRVLVDAPCSNTGVMRRRVDLRWRLRPGELERLSRMQQQLLSRALERLRPGGVLVYSTCSLEPEENRGVVDALLSAHPGLVLAQERLLTPFADAVDGAYAAALVWHADQADATTLRPGPFAP